MFCQLSPDLLWRHVAHCPQDYTGFGLVRYGFGVITFRLRQLCQSEVEDLDPSVAGDKDVLRLEVAVDNAFLVSCRQPLRQLYRVLDGFAYRQRSAGKSSSTRYKIGRAH